MKKLLRILLRILGIIILLIALGFISFQVYYWQLNRKAKASLKEKPTLTANGYSYKDLNANGTLDIYEDVRAPIEERVSDLLSQMNIEEKVGLMWHPPMGIGSKGEILEKPDPGAFFMNSTYNMLVNKKIRYYNLFRAPGAAAHASWYNRLQKIAEQDRLGIPVSISTDPRHGAINFLEDTDMLSSPFSKWPEPIGLAATGDSMLTAEFGHIANQEYRALGIRIALHPMADLATEPRWARINGTFGEDAALSSKLTAAYIYGFQGDSLHNQSVACMTKHWPGGGPQKDGEDAHFRYGKDQVYPGNNFDYHVIPFEAAFKAGTGMIMPYYGVPVGQTSEDVGMSFNKEIITDMLRGEYGYDGVVCTDWGILTGFKVMGREIVAAKDHGVDQLTIPQKIQKAIEAGVDQFGGNDLTEELLELVRNGNISEERIDASVRRLLKLKFTLGLFENPYVDESKISATIARKDFVEKGMLAQKKSIVLLKNDTINQRAILPLEQSFKVYVENISKDAVSQYATVVDSIEESDIALLHLQTPWEPRSGDMLESMFHQGYLDFQEPELSRILSIMEQKPTILSLYMSRPAVIPEIAENTSGLLVDFGVSDEALLEVVFGKFNPSGHLPFEVPSSMPAVLQQKEDVPFDSKEPLFPFGAGISYE